MTSGISKFPIPGVSQPGQAGDAASGSLLASLRATAARKREASTKTLGLPGRWAGTVRARYGVVSLDDLERYADTSMQTSGADLMNESLEILARACQAIEGKDPETGEWQVLEDELGPVTFDDRLALLLDWPRPDGDFTFSVRTVYETMFDGNGVALGQHVAEVSQFMGLVQEDAGLGEASTGGGSTPSAPPPPSG